MAGFWKAPRALARLLVEHELCPSAYTLLHFVVECGADRGEGFATTNGFLAGSLGISERTVRRSLQSLRARGLLDYDDHERVTVFTIRAADTLAALVSAPVSAPVSAGAADSPPSSRGREAASQAGSTEGATADTSRARAETETETENHLTSFGGAPPSTEVAVRETNGPPAQALVAFYVDSMRALGVEPPKRLIGQVAKQVVELAREGQPLDVIAKALKLLTEKRHLGPSALPSLIPEAAAGPGRAGREHPADTLLRDALRDRERPR